MSQKGIRDRQKKRLDLLTRDIKRAEKDAIHWKKGYDTVKKREGELVKLLNTSKSIEELKKGIDEANIYPRKKVQNQSKSKGDELKK